MYSGSDLPGGGPAVKYVANLPLAVLYQIIMNMNVH